jgi:hypothetical protein
MMDWAAVNDNVSRRNVSAGHGLLLSANDPFLTHPHSAPLLSAIAHNAFSECHLIKHALTNS